MKFASKIFSVLSFCVSLTFLPKKSLGQQLTPYVSIGNPILETINMVKVNKEFDRKAKMGSMMDSQILGKSVIYNSKYGFEILFKDSTQKKTYSNIYFDTVLRKCYLVLIDKKFPKSDTANRRQVIYPDQTLKISRINAEGRTLTGIANDTCWMFKIISGSITAYSYLSEENGPTFNSWTIIGIQQNDDQIIKYNVENLKQLVGQNSDAMEDIENKNYIKAIKEFNRKAKRVSKK